LRRLLAALLCVGLLSAPAPERVSYIALTFDDGPSAYTEKLLDVLDKYNVKATFFVVDTGRYDVLEDEYRRGHTIGVHSASHDYAKIYASADAFWDDFDRMADIIYEHTGERPELLRFPGGSSNTVSSFDAGIMTRLAAQAQERGYAYFDWNVLSGDAGQTKDTAQVVKNVIEGIKAHKKSVVLQHDSQGFSVDAVEQIIVWGQENGYTFLPLTKDSYAAHHVIAN